MGIGSLAIVKYVVINAVNTVMIDKKTPHPRAIIE